MTFDDNIKEKEYVNFWCKSKQAHFLNSYWWGICNKNTRKQDPVYVGLRDEDNNIVCETLLLKRKTPLNMCYFYAPRGFLIDWQNKDLVATFTKELKKYLIKEKAIYLKVDPAIIYQEVDDEANPIPNGYNNKDLFNYILSLGYHHCGFNKLYEHNQPRYTFRTIFNNQSWEEIESKFSKTVLRNIKRSYNYNLEISLGKDINDFYRLAQDISTKDGFKLYSKKYYEDIFNYYEKEGYLKNFIVSINPQEVINKLQKDLSGEKNQDKINKINKDIEYFKDKDKQVIGSLICIYTNYGGWSLYIGNNDIALYTNAVNRLYYEFIKDCYDNKLEFADLFGVCGDPHTKYKNLGGIFEYKRKLGGTCLEYMGEFDLINKPFWYKVLPILLKIYRKIKG